MSQGLFAAVSGIRANQTKLNVISNNIANINTVAFKSSQVNFKTLFSQTISTGTVPTSAVGGTNPRQIGNGVAVSDIIQNFNSGGSLYTGRSSDLMIEGEGFFTIERSDVDLGSGEPGFYLTRAGNFTLDADNNLVTAGGNKVVGTRTVQGNDPTTVTNVNLPAQIKIWKERDVSDSVTNTWLDVYGTAATPAATAGGAVTGEDVTLINYSFGVDGSISATYSNGDRVTVRTDPSNTNLREMFHIASDGTNYAPSYATDPTESDGELVVLNNVYIPEQIQLRMCTVSNPAGLLHEGANNFSVAANTGTVNLGVGNFGGRGQVTSGALESSNVDVAGEFTNLIIAQRGLEASGKVITSQSEVLRTIINLI